jgi:hypothetical protein
LKQSKSTFSALDATPTPKTSGGLRVTTAPLLNSLISKYNWIAYTENFLKPVLASQDGGGINEW